jgi:hypothetical protein
MTTPTSLRLPTGVRARLERLAADHGERAASLATRRIDEDLRMTEFPGVVFKDSAASGRVPRLMRGPEVAVVITVLSGLEATGEARITETAEWLDIHPTEVRLAIAYHTTFAAEVDERIMLHERSAAEERARYDVEQALLG